MTRGPAKQSGAGTTDDINFRTLPLMPPPKLPTKSQQTTTRQRTTSEASQIDANLQRTFPEDAVKPHMQHQSAQTPELPGHLKDAAANAGLPSSRAQHNPMDLDGRISDDAYPMAPPALYGMRPNSSAEIGDGYGDDGKVANADSGGSRESSAVTQNSTGEDWFNTFNKDVGSNQNFVRYENDSPYYVPKNPSVSETIRDPLGQLRPLQSDSTSGSASESYRSVIDDLTVKNQKLKRKLRKYEGVRGREAGERLFEVRIHNLPEAKKLELEQLLRTFSASLEEDNGEQQTRVGSNDITPPELRSQRSTTVPDSGYGSNSAHCHDRSPVPNNLRHSSGESLRMFAKGTKASELNKMKQVVGKLEQLFTGGEAALVDRTQLIQQQNISNMAAAADKRAAEAMGLPRRQSGSREAPITSAEQTGFSIDKTTPSSDKTTPTSDATTPDVPEQRPTRPMDLDPGRKQVGTENIEYLTNMTESSQQEGSPYGWVYLNLVINLAQLHTISVTPPFVRKAIATVSDKLELSADGTMIRWKGNKSNDATPEGSGSRSAGSSATPGSDPHGILRRDSSKESSESLPQQLEDVDPLPQETAESKFQYKPIIYKSPSSEDDSSSFAASTEPESSSPEMGKGSSDEYGNKKKEPAVMIYYKNGNFWTDLSCTHPGQESSDGSSFRYERVTDMPLGQKALSAYHSNSTRDSPLYQAAHALASGSGAVDEDSELDMDPASHTIRFSPVFTPTKEASHKEPIEFEASGIGGVMPADNFAINCQTKHYLLPESQGGLPVSRSRIHKKQKRIMHRVSKAAVEAFQDDGNHSDSSTGNKSRDGKHKSDSSADTSPSRRHRVRGHEILSADRLQLPPSSLPPASYLFASPSEDSSSSSEELLGPPSRPINVNYLRGSQRGMPLQKYLMHSSSSDDNDPPTRRRSLSFSPGSNNPQLSSSPGECVEEFEDDDDDDDMFDAGQPYDDSSSGGNPRGRGPVRPNLKRGRGSDYRSSSTSQIRKNQKVGDLGF